MRIWTIHPACLDRQGLIALWREALLAQKVILGKTRGYKNHPQLERFKKHRTPVAAIATYLEEVCNEAARRGYHFVRRKIRKERTTEKIRVSSGQLSFEQKHLLRKIERRHGKVPDGWNTNRKPASHPLFRIVPGNIESWEKTT